eukprot:scaffold90121_cov69-Phaeocystis_antarctica.AAC.4
MCVRSGAQALDGMAVPGVRLLLRELLRLPDGGGTVAKSLTPKLLSVSGKCGTCVLNPPGTLTLSQRNAQPKPRTTVNLALRPHPVPYAGGHASCRGRRVTSRKLLVRLQELPTNPACRCQESCSPCRRRRRRSPSREARQSATLVRSHGRTAASLWALGGSAARAGCVRVAQPGAGRASPRRPGRHAEAPVRRQFQEAAAPCRRTHRVPDGSTRHPRSPEGGA